MRMLRFLLVATVVTCTGAPFLDAQGPGSATSSPPRFTAWSAPVRVEGYVNTPASETCVSISRDGLTLYFGRLSAGTGYDLYVTQRDSTDAPWAVPYPVPGVNSAANEFCPALSLDEHRLFFASARPGGCGDGFTDIYASRRHNRQDDLGWLPPENLGCASQGFVNSERADQAPSFFEDESGAIVMYFATNRVIAQGFDIYKTILRPDGTFGPASPATELNVPGSNEIGTAVRRDGLEIIVDSTRPGGLGGRDLWTATRNSTTAPWSALVNLAAINTPAADSGRLSMSFDGTALYFTSDRDATVPGDTDIYVTTRSRVRGKPE